MRPQLSALTLVLALLVGSVGAAQPRPVPSTPGVRFIELPHTAASQEHEVAVSPGIATLLRFHGGSITREGVVLEGDERVAMYLLDNLIVLVPSERVVPGERLRLRVFFEDGQVPAGTHFALLVQTATVEHQVEVHRQRRSAESLRAELQAQGEQLQSCIDRVARLQVEQARHARLTGLRASGWVGVKGVGVKLIGAQLSQHSENAPRVWDAYSFRSARSVMVEIELSNPPGAAPWTAARAAFLDRAGEELGDVTVWQPEPILPGGKGRVLLEVLAEEAGERGPFVVKLWGADGQGSVTVDNVTFP